jgi:hypothetical protein
MTDLMLPLFVSPDGRANKHGSLQARKAGEAAKDGMLAMQEKDDLAC